jgi:hypothetical protein
MREKGAFSDHQVPFSAFTPPLQPKLPHVFVTFVHCVKHGGGCECFIIKPPLATARGSASSDNVFCVRQLSARGVPPHHRSDEEKILLLLPLPLPLLRYEQALTEEQGPYSCGSLLFCAAVVAIHHPLTAPSFLLKVSSTAASLVGWLQCRALPPPQLFSCSSSRSCC